ncbi:MAG: TatD family hydrolase [Lentimicrobium sp.]|uniref:TatD family hydrolase n=1 Tax=Lentimicrobium sp. TaxID=2034841 RepID=UPI0025E0A650|nr:TatD family hydrolase [Lentimicrobium sp.]MCO5257286.1 TatD family hydrolase [Lentimicrobium sp.]HPF65278.1 TatD family hydrolase [Lentimicrobium sp.]
MIFTDTHTHLYLEEFDQDRREVIEKATGAGVRYMMLPNIDSTSISTMLALADEFPANCFPMMGLHPTSVKENFREELAIVENQLQNRRFYGIGECGIDLYWDKTFAKEQEVVFRHHIELALSYNLPLIVHIRESFNEVIRILRDANKPDLRGIFHCFSGSPEQAKQATGLGFSLGLGGVITFKNNRMQETLKHVDMKHLVLETDAPFLAPMPYRGKRNDPSYIPLIAEKVAEIKGISVEEVARATTENARKLFRFDD